MESYGMSARENICLRTTGNAVSHSPVLYRAAWDAPLSSYSQQRTSIVFAFDDRSDTIGAQRDDGETATGDIERERGAL